MITKFMIVEISAANTSYASGINIFNLIEVHIPSYIESLFIRNKINETPKWIVFIIPFL